MIKTFLTGLNMICTERNYCCCGWQSKCPNIQCHVDRTCSYVFRIVR